MLTESEDSLPETVSIRGYNPVYVRQPPQIREAAQALAKAERPLFYVGGGLDISGAAELFAKAQEIVDVPTVCVAHGDQRLPSAHPRFLGMIGMHGTYAANTAVQNCDLLFAIGTRFDDRATGDLAKFAPHASVVHVDVDPASICRNVAGRSRSSGTRARVLEDLLPHLRRPDTRVDSDTDDWKTTHPLADIPRQRPSLPDRGVHAISAAFPDAIVTTEVGPAPDVDGAVLHVHRPRTFLTSGGLGTMGYGFPAAIGAQLGNPDRRVIDIAGDGSIQMNIQELATAVSERLPVIVAIMNNGYLGMVRQWQELFYESTTRASAWRGPRCEPDCAQPDENCPPYVPGFREARRGIRRGGDPCRANPEEVEPGAPRGETDHRPPRLHRLPHRAGGKRVAHGAGGAGIHEMMNA